MGGVIVQNLKFCGVVRETVQLTNRLTRCGVCGINKEHGVNLWRVGEVHRGRSHLLWTVTVKAEGG